MKVIFGGLLILISSCVKLPFSANSNHESNSSSAANTTVVALPDAPSAISLISQTNTIGHDDTPTFSISGVVSGNTIKLFSDSSCTTLLASGIASSTSISLTTSALSSAGTITVYANATNSSGSSSCSTATASYQYYTCPTTHGSFSRVGENTTLNTSTFCVMTYEAKDVASAPYSQPELAPITNITGENASIACRALGTGYDLISNDEWLAIAYETENNYLNWSGGSVGSGCMYQGNSATTTACSYVAGAQDFGTSRDSKARLYLTSGDQVWDMSGNVGEWADWTTGGSLSAGPTTCTDNGFEDFSGVACGALTNIEFMPNNPSNQSTYDNNYGIGAFQGGNQGGAYRGGTRFQGANETGIYNLSLAFNYSWSNAEIGYRCVYRP